VIGIRDSRAGIRRLGAAAVVMAAISGTTLAAAQFGWLKKDDKSSYKRLENASRDFAFEYPKDWLVLGGAGSTVLTLAEKKGEATVAIPAGSDLDRVVCSASLTQFQKFQPMFEHIASTFTLKSPRGTR
jgi:hypothetical protein